MRPALHGFFDAAGRWSAVLVWRHPTPQLTISSAVLGGGLGPRRWVINMTVPADYQRTDPQEHLRSVAADFALPGPGVGLMTAVDVRRAVTATDAGVVVTATVGLRTPSWAAAPDDPVPVWRLPPDAAAPPPGTSASLGTVNPPGTSAPVGTLNPPGTVNIVAYLPVRLSEAALVNAIATVTEAKAQALWELGVTGTGTASDAICISCPPAGAAEPFGGPRSTWGARLARAVRNAVYQGGLADQDGNV